jgi:hypothetical protein|uniref:hypothetical protein n=1 Tax=Rhodococcus qingshengii TaxID=334542 RepID=UPI003CE57472
MEKNIDGPTLADRADQMFQLVDLQSARGAGEVVDGGQDRRIRRAPDSVSEVIERMTEIQQPSTRCEPTSCTGNDGNQLVDR